MNTKSLEVDGIEVRLSVAKAKKLVEQLTVDEIFDALAAMVSKRKISKSEIKSRFIGDYGGELKKLLKEFWDDSNRHPTISLDEAAAQLELWEDFIDGL